MESSDFLNWRSYGKLRQAAAVAERYITTPDCAAMSSNHGSPAENASTYADALRAAPRSLAINTTIARSGPASSISGATTTSPVVSSAGPSSLGSARTAATSLYTSSSKSPGTPFATQSATIPKKLSWDRPLAGLGLQMGNVTPSTDASTKHTSESPNVAATTANRPVSPTRYQFKQHNILQDQNSPYAKQASESPANTYPLPQYPFGSSRLHADQHRIIPGSIASPQTVKPYNIPIGSERKASLAAVANDGVHDTTGGTPHAPDAKQRPDSAVGGHADDDDDGSVFSTITDWEAARRLQAVSDKSEVVQQDAHFKGFAKNLRFNEQPGYLDAAFDKAYMTLKTVNADYHELPPRTRVVCIKTDFVTNVQWAMQRNMWAAMDKVGERIMRCWNERQSKDEKILLLCSVNGQKSYCGLAEMIGPFELDTDIEHWRGADDGNVQWGAIPVTWKYIKNVAYGWFNDIRHSHNDSNITNMWNGMHFPVESGLTVVKRFIQRPHFTNIICWEKTRPYHPLHNVQPWQIDPTLGVESVRGKKKQKTIHDRRMPFTIEDTKGSDNSGGTNTPSKQSSSGFASSNATLSINTNVAQPRQSPDKMDVDPPKLTPTPSRWDALQPQHRSGVSQYQQSPNTTKTHQPMYMATPHRASALQHGINSTPANLNQSSDHSPRPGQVMKIEAFYDAHGNLVPITPGGSQYHSVGFQAPGGNTASARGSMHVSGPQLAHGGDTRGLGRGGYTQRGNYSAWGSMQTPASRSFTAYSDFAGQHPRVESKTPTTVRPHADVGVLDVFQTPHHLRSTRSMAIVAPPAFGIANEYVSPLHRAVSAADFVPQQHSNEGTAASSYNSHPTTAIYRGAATTVASSLAGSGGLLPPSHLASPSIAISHSYGADTDSMAFLKKGPSSLAPSDSYSQMPTNASFDTKLWNEETEAREFKEKRGRYFSLMKMKLNIEIEEAKRDYEDHPHFGKDFDPERQNGSDSEQGGLGCWVSTSSVEKGKISPMGSLPDSGWDTDTVEKMRAEGDLLGAVDSDGSCAVSVAASSHSRDSKVGGGVDL